MFSKQINVLIIFVIWHSNDFRDLIVVHKKSLIEILIISTVSTYKSKKKPTNMKPISVKDEKILNQAIEIANEMSAR